MLIIQYPIWTILRQLHNIVYEMNIKFDEIDKKVGKKVRVERTKRDLSQEKLAELANINTATVGTVERGDNATTVQTLAKISNALNIELYKLFIFD